MRNPPPNPPHHPLLQLPGSELLLCRKEKWQAQMGDKGNSCVPPGGQIVACKYCGRQSTCMFQDEAEFAGGSAFATAAAPWPSVAVAASNGRQWDWRRLGAGARGLPGVPGGAGRATGGAFAGLPGWCHGPGGGCGKSTSAGRQRSIGRQWGRAQ